MLSKEEIKEIIEKRIFSGEPFTFAQLHSGLPDFAYRIADRLIQKHRRNGKINFVRDGRKTIWSLVSE